MYNEFHRTTTSPKDSNLAKQLFDSFQKWIQRLQLSRRMLGSRSIAKESLISLGRGKHRGTFCLKSRGMLSVRWPKRNRAWIASVYCPN